MNSVVFFKTLGVNPFYGKYDISVDVHTVATEAKLKKRKREPKNC